MDEFAYSHNHRRVGKVVRGQQVLPQQIFQCPDGSLKHASRVHGEVKYTQTRAFLLPVIT
jgi:hypothetical protein